MAYNVCAHFLFFPPQALLSAKGNRNIKLYNVLSPSVCMCTVMHMCVCSAVFVPMLHVQQSEITTKRPNTELGI